MGEYQRSPQLGPLGPLGAGLGKDRGDDATSASYTELPASYKPAPRRRPGAGQPDPGGAAWRRWLRSHMAWAGWAAVGAALVVVGVVLGAALSSSSSQNPTRSSGSVGGLPPGPPLPPRTVCGSSGHAGGGPNVCMVSQSLGTTRTAWLVNATGFAPRTPVTVTLRFNSPPTTVPAQTFTRTARVKPVTGPDGTVRLDINQLFPGALQLGMFDVQVDGPSGREASTTFIVIPVGA
jgi:hypothetical protein